MKVPIAQYFFPQTISTAEDLGTGIRNVFMFSTLYSGKLPQFNEEDLFEVTIPLIEEKTTPKTTPKTIPKKPIKTQESLIVLIQEKPTISKKELAQLLGISIDGVRYHIRELKKKKIIKYVGASKGGKWLIIKSN